MNFHSIGHARGIHRGLEGSANNNSADNKGRVKGSRANNDCGITIAFACSYLLCTFDR